MCEDLAYFGCTPMSARQGDVQHFGAYIVDMLYTIYSAQRGVRGKGPVSITVSLSRRTSPREVGRKEAWLSSPA
eukprot:184558-Amphidinium_carterae.1